MAGEQVTDDPFMEINQILDRIEHTLDEMIEEARR